MILVEASALGDWPMLLTHDGTIFWSSGRITGRQALTMPTHGSTVDQMSEFTFVPITNQPKFFKQTGVNVNIHVASTYPTLDR